MQYLLPNPAKFVDNPANFVQFEIIISLKNELTLYLPDNHNVYNLFI